MTPAATIALSTVSLIGIWYSFTTLLREYKVEKFRQDAFALRDRLFDEARLGHVSFSDPAYGLLRNLMNGFIRSAHRMSLLQVLTSILFVPDPPREQSFSARLEAATEGLSNARRALYVRYHSELSVLAIRQVMWGSPFLILTMVVPIVGFFAVQFYMERVLAALKKPIGEIDNIAMVCGEAAV